MAGCVCTLQLPADRLKKKDCLPVAASRGCCLRLPDGQSPVSSLWVRPQYARPTKATRKPVLRVPAALRLPPHF